jgi:signal transduction histidine kinase
MRRPRRSLRTWLIAPTAAIVTILSATGALLQTDTLVRAWLGSTRQLSELAARQVTEFVLLRLEGVDPSQRQAWLARIDNDAKLGGLLESSASGANSIVEISVVDATGVVLASSNRSRPGNPAALVQPLSSLFELEAIARIRAVWAPGREYELRVPVGLRGESRPLFIVQVLVSNALLRETLIPGIRRIVASASLAYLVALALVWVVAEVTRRNLRRIEDLIDHIGDDTSPLDDRTRPAPATTEFDAVESKLTLMQGRVRGALHEAQDYRERVGALLKALEEAVILFEGERIVLVAGAVQNLLGWKPDEVNGREADDLFPSNASLFKLLRARWRSGEPAHNVESEWPVGAALRRLSVNIDFIPDGSDPLRTLTLLRVRDTEGATEVESQLQVVSRLEAINRLTGGVAHEIKNPLNAIAARMALIESIVEGDAEAEKEVRVVADEIQRLDRVVRTFLDFTQPLEVSREELDLGALAESVVAAIEPDARNRGISLQYSGQPNVVWARGDRDLLHQALLNIIVNAVEATPAGGEVRVAASVSDGACRLRISDTGPGIPEPVKKKLFQLYFTTKSGGSGIGLAVAYRSLQLHGGDIKVETKLGEGTSFELIIPALPKEAVAIA